ncbi:MAG: EAL domain-containing protein [Cyanobacteriota bacterium]|nr:EAL domain-containing protein [Cyanobacteriota bacterium]
MEPTKESVITIVDDNPTNLKVLFKFLNESGFKVLVAKNAISAIEKVKQTLPDLILLDVMMPGIDGFETCSRLKAEEATKDIPVIFMTGLSEPVDKLKGLELGAVDYITKPFHQEEVLARIKLHIRFKRLTETLQSQNQLLKLEIASRTAVESSLQRLTDELEERVEKRTAQLTKAVEDLQQAQVKLLQREEKLRYDAFHDTLTNLPNRAWFINRLKFLIELNARESDYLYAVLFLDLDRFKVVNDSLGHLVGDELLKSVSIRLQASLDEMATVARFGGDEFVILLEDIKDVCDATAVASRIKRELRLPFYLKDYELFVAGSIGIALGKIEYEKPEEVLRDADVAMYRAKHNGRARYEVFDPEMQELVMARLHLENDLRRAIATTLDPNLESEFCLHYQPIVSLRGGEILGFEALVRWNHPSRGCVSPGQFIPVAEETGLINELGWWILREGCRQMKSWLKLGGNVPLRMNVNLSPVQLLQVDIVEGIQEIIQETALPPNCLKLEITESCVLDISSEEAQVLKQLKSLGMQLCIDDFGTGYSSLSRLYEFPIDTLKIDMSFVRRIGQENGGEEIIQTIINLANSLGMSTVGEGIDTTQKLNKLEELGCDLGQGFLFSKPVDSLKATALLSDYNRRTLGEERGGAKF